MRVLSNGRRLFVSKKRSEDLKPSRLMYGGDTRSPTFIFKLGRIQMRPLPVVYAPVDNLRAFRKRNGRTSYHSDFAFWRADTHLAPGERSESCPMACFYFSSIVSGGDIVSRWGDIWREGLIKLVFCGGRDVNEQLSNETRHCSLNNGCFRSAIVSIIENDTRRCRVAPPVLNKTCLIGHS